MIVIVSGIVSGGGDTAVDPVTFQKKWIVNTLKERSASQSHFNDLCAVLGQPTPTDADPTGEFYTFERGAAKLSGGDGWADVWFRGHFAWEYKGKRADLAAAWSGPRPTS